jgi:hypothetical protein
MTLTYGCLGAAIGASALNQRFRQRAITILKEETYLLEVYSAADIHLVPKFEREAKKKFERRNVDTPFRFPLTGLKACKDTANVYRENIRNQAFVLTRYVTIIFTCGLAN